MLSKEGRIGLVVCTISLVMLGLAPTQRKRPPILGQQFKLVFHECKGLRDGDPVTVGGVDAGRVVDIDFAPPEDWKKLNPAGNERPVVLVTVALRQGFPLSPGTGYKVVSTLRGNHFINILPSPPGQTVPDGSILNGELQSESDDQLQATIRHFKDLSQRTKDMRAQFADPVFRRDMKDLASNMRFYSAEFMRISEGSRQQVEKLSDQLERQENTLIANVHKMDNQATRVAAYLRTFVPSFRQTLGTYKRRLADAQKQLDAGYVAAGKYNQQLADFAQQLENGPIGKLDKDKIAQTVHEYKRMIEDRADIAGDMHMISSDKQFIDDTLLSRLRKIKATSQQWKEQARDYEKRVNGLNFLLGPRSSETPQP